MAESYDELVFSEPMEAFHSRVKAQAHASPPATSLSQHFPSNSLAFASQELQNVTVARQKNAQILASLQAQLDRYG